MIENTASMKECPNFFSERWGNLDKTVRTQFKTINVWIEKVKKERETTKNCRWMKQCTLSGQLIGCVVIRKKEMIGHPSSRNSGGQRESRLLLEDVPESVKKKKRQRRRKYSNCKAFVVYKKKQKTSVLPRPTKSLHNGSSFSRNIE